MASTVNNVKNELIKFRTDVAKAFLRAGRFDPFTSSSPTAIIQRVADLAADGKEVRVPLVNQLASSGVATGTLVGNEEAIDSYGMPMWADWARTAVVFDKNTKKESAINIRDLASPLLQAWTRKVRRDDMIKAFHSFPTASIQSGRGTGSGNRVNGVTYANATATQRNNWLTANSDRVVFGSAVGNLSAGNYATSLGNVDTTNDRMTAAIGSLLKRKAQLTGAPTITPYQVEGTDEEWFVCFLGSRAFRDLKADPVMYQANRDARAREGSPENKNPIFTGSSTLVYDGVIYKEVPEFDSLLLLSAAGASSADVAPIFLCGQNALAYVVGQMPKPTTRDETDYQFLTGIGIEMQFGAGKVAKAPVSSAGSNTDLVDFGMVTGHVAAPADA